MFSRGKLIGHFFRSNKLLLTVAFLASVAGSLLNVLIPVSIGRFYQLVLHDDSIKGKLFADLHISLPSVSEFFFFFIMLVIAKSAITFAEKFFTGIIGERFSKELRELLFHTQLSQSLATNQLKPTGKYLLRYSGDLLFVQQFVTRGIIQFTGDVLFMIAATGVLYYINAALTLMLLAGILLACGMLILLNKKLRAATLTRRNQRSALLGFVANRMMAFFTIKSFNREIPEQIQYNNRSAKLYDLGVRYWKIYAVVQSLLPLFMFGTLTLLLYYISLERGVKPYGIHRTDVLDFILIFLYMQAVIRRILKVNVVWQMGNVSFIKLLRILNLPAESKGAGPEINRVEGRISFEHVSFRYEKSYDAILRDLSFNIEPNTITHIRGKQSSGKSTILKLVQGMYSVSEGKILLDEYDYSLLPPNSIRRNVAIVSDEAPLIGNTVFKAVSYSRAEEKRLKAEQWLRRVNFRAAESDDADLDFALSDFGKNLSAGQRRQLMFARAFLTRKKILLLDECFDDLDQASLKIIVDLLNKQKTKRTILIAGNNMPPALKVDHVIDLNSFLIKNQLVES